MSGTEVVVGRATPPQPEGPLDRAQIVIRDPQLDYSARLGMWLAAAESNSTDPKVLGMAAALRIEYARLLNLPPHAASEIHVIKGNLSVSAKLCRALARERGVKVDRVEEGPDFCTAAVIDLKSGLELGRTTVTLEQIKRAGVKTDAGSNWAKFPDRMLWARASKRALDDHAPWVTVGVMTDDDVEDAGWQMREQVALTGADVIDAEEALELSGAEGTQPINPVEEPQPAGPPDAPENSSGSEPLTEGADVVGEEPLPASESDPETPDIVEVARSMIVEQIMFKGEEEIRYAGRTLGDVEDVAPEWLDWAVTLGKGRWAPGIWKAFGLIVEARP